MPLYIPPVNLQIGGNTSGASTLVMSGTLTLAGGNNITLSQNGNAITISGGAGGGGAAVGISQTFGNTAGTTGTFTSGTVIFAGGQNITLSQSTGAGGVHTLSIVGAPTGVAAGISTQGNTAGSTGLFTSGSVLLVGGNRITLSQSTAAGGATLSIVGPAALAAGMSNVGNTAGTSGTFTNGTLVFAGGNNISLSQSTGAGGVHTLSIAAPTGVAAGISTQGNTAGSTGLFTSGSVILVGGNNITLSQSTAAGGATLSIVGGAGGGGAAVGMATAGNTQGISGTFTSGTVYFAGGNNITVSQSTDGGGATMSIIGGAGGGGAAVGISTGGNTAGSTGLFTSGSVVLVGGNNITLSQSTGPSGATLSIVGGAGAGNFSAGVSNLGNTTGTSGTVTQQIVFVGGNNVTLSQSVNGGSATVTISNGNVLLSVYEPYPLQVSGTGAISFQSNTSGGMSLFRFNVSEPIAAEYLKMVVSMNFTTGGTSSFQQSGTLQWGIYSNGTGTNASRMSLMGSSSLSYAVTYNNSAITISQATTTGSSGTYGYSTTASTGLNITSGYTGLKLFALGLNSTITQGDYWLGIYHRNSSSSFNSGLRMSLYGVTHTLTGLAPMGSFSSAGSTGTNVANGLLGANWLLAHGSYTVTGMTGLTNDITMSQITQNIGLMPYMKFETRV